MHQFSFLKIITSYDDNINMAMLCDETIRKFIDLHDDLLFLHVGCVLFDIVMLLQYGLLLNTYETRFILLVLIIRPSTINGH